MRPEDTCVRQMQASMAQEQAFLERVLEQNSSTQSATPTGQLDIYVPEVDVSPSDAAVVAYQTRAEQLRREIEAIDANTKYQVQTIERQNISDYESSAREWSSTVTAAIKSMKQTEDEFCSARDEAQTRIYQDVYEIERLRALHTADAAQDPLFQSPRIDPSTRLRRTQVTSMVTRQMVPPCYLSQASELVEWLAACGIAKKYADGKDFLEDLASGTRPFLLHKASKPCIEALHHALTLLPPERWGESKQEIARILQMVNA